MMVASIGLVDPPAIAVATNASARAASKMGRENFVIRAPALNQVLPLLISLVSMDQSNNAQNRKSRRSNVLMSASLELSGTSLPVKLRNLSAEGALVEGDKLPIEGASI